MVTPSTSVTNTHATDAILASMRKHVMDALKVMSNRMIAEVEHSASTDVKENLRYCEFGMILLLVKDWLRTQSLENEFYSQIQPADYQRLSIDLVKNVIARIVPRKQDQEGGEGKENRICFFTGEPYTKYIKAGKASRYSAHLDAAMITLAFLARAVEQFNESLTKIPHELEATLPDWVGNLRDAALFVILEGLHYATDCRVLDNNKFLGFSSDPKTNAAHRENGGLSEETDRLFFTWTTCETIDDMKSWRNSYLNARVSPAPPDVATKEIRSLIEGLEKTLSDAATWCEEHFLPAFQEFKIEDPRDLVREVNSKKAAVLGDRLEQSIKEVATSVQHVYHFSQYAAVRSLVPQQVTLAEVRTVVDKLDRLVMTSIMSSGLDESEQEDLFRTLTRTYSLGDSNTTPYVDDAWYPLVVRSLSGLLTRTLSDFRGRYSRSEVHSLTLSFQRSLETHVNNLLVRRPRLDQEGDEKLWSFAIGAQYELYATQRTIFALLEYADFIKEVDRFQNEKVVDKLEDDLALMAGRKFADSYFLPLIREMRLQLEAKMAS